MQDAFLSFQAPPHVDVVVGPSMPPPVGAALIGESRRHPSATGAIESSATLAAGAAFAAAAAVGTLQRRRLVKNAVLSASTLRVCHTPSSSSSSSSHARPVTRASRIAMQLFTGGGGSPKGDAGKAEDELEKMMTDLEEIEDELEDFMSDENLDKRSKALESKVDNILKNAPAARATSGVVPSSDSARSSTMPCVAVCGVGSSEGSGVGAQILSRLRKAGGAEPIWIDLAGCSKLPAEKLDAMLVNCEAGIICPNIEEDDAEALEAARIGVKAVLASCPVDGKGPGLTRMFVLSRVGAQADKGGFDMGSFFGKAKTVGWADLEDELTAAARLRTRNNPLRIIVARVGPSPAVSSSSIRVKCLPADEGIGGSTSPAVAAEAVLQALSLSVNASFAVVQEPVTNPELPNWPELLLPFIGPEVWRTEVADPTRVALFLQSWAEEFFVGANKRFRFGVKTPVQVENTPSGAYFKFRPLDTGKEVSFNDLNEGGVEFIAETPAAGPPRLRAVRRAYDWKVQVKLNSEKALVEKFAQDWAEVEKMRVAAER